MVELIAIIRRKHASATKEELSRIGCNGYTAFPVFGRGKQRGLRSAPEGQGLAFLPKVLFEIVVEETRAQETIEAIIRTNQTGQYGDGKIFVMGMAEAYRISTGLPAPPVGGAQAGERGPTAEATEVAPG